MIAKLTHTFIYVLDQDEALQFYTEKLGFNVIANIPLGPNKRWLTVAPPGDSGIEIVLMKASVGPFFTDESADSINSVVSKGQLGWCVFSCPNIYATYEELIKKGVEFIHPPTETPSGISANFRDNSGNWFSLQQDGE